MRPNIPALTGVRYLAAFLIVLHHLTGVTGISLVDHLVHEMNVGVTIFFVLSGFLISYRYFDDYKSTPLWRRSYIVNRAARILPMYFLVTCFTFMVGFRTLADHSDLLHTFLLNITFLRGFSQKHVYTGIAQGWTLTVEETFYLLAPFIFYWSRRVGLVFQTLIFLSMGCLLICLPGLMNIKMMLICTFFGRSFEFMCGIMLYLVIKNNSFAPKVKITFLSIVAFAGLVALMTWLSYPPYAYAIQNPVGLVVNNVLFPISVSFVLWGLIKEKTALQRLLSTRMFDILGRSSYVLYLIHYGVFSYLVSHFISSNLFIDIVVLQLMAILGWKFVEEPLNKLIKTGFGAPTRILHWPIAKAA
jgi:peptidoglycan/LPS O-acetylase OafA/YrhL